MPAWLKRQNQAVVSDLLRWKHQLKLVERGIREQSRRLREERSTARSASKTWPQPVERGSNGPEEPR